MRNFIENFYALVSQIPKGKVSTYGELAKALGDIRASRTVGQMLAANPRPVIVPCHRVVMTDGNIGGYSGSGGINKKIELLRSEGVSIKRNHVIDFQRFLYTNFETDLPLKKLAGEQRKLGKKVLLMDGFSNIETVAGIDVAYTEDTAYGACVVYDYHNKNFVEEVIVKAKVEFPYIPTFLGYRELPVIEKLIKKLKVTPTIFMIDGNGILHPLKFGIASHVGVKMNVPTIGVAKTLLLGKVMKNLIYIGNCSEIIYNNEVLGYALKSSQKGNPIYVSPGHKISFKTALGVVKCFCKYKVPEPIRSAHLLATKFRNQ
jgi:deoxyribonuclease V